MSSHQALLPESRAALDASCISPGLGPFQKGSDVGLIDDTTINRHGVCGALLHARHPTGLFKHHEMALLLQLRMRTWRSSGNVSDLLRPLCRGEGGLGSLGDCLQPSSEPLPLPHLPAHLFHLNPQILHTLVLCFHLPPAPSALIYHLFWACYTWNQHQHIPSFLHYRCWGWVAA